MSGSDSPIMHASVSIQSSILHPLFSMLILSSRPRTRPVRAGLTLRDSPFRYSPNVIDHRRLESILKLLVQRSIIHAGQERDVLNRGRDQARHILLDKRAEMRRLLGRHRVAYRVSEIELIASFRFEHHKDKDIIVDEELVTRAVAEDLGLAYVHLDPLKLDYKMVTETFGGPFAERHLVIPVSETKTEMTLAMANPWPLLQITMFLSNIFHSD